jgi:plastocyanin
MTRFALSLAVAIALSSTIAGCGGGGAGKPASLPPPGGSGTGSTTSSPQSTTFALTSAASTHALPSVAGFGGSVSLPAASAPAGTTMTISLSTTAPAGVTLPQNALRRPASGFGGVSVLAFLTFTASGNVTFSGVPAFSLTIPSSANAAGQFFLALSQSPGNALAAQFITEGPAAVSGTMLGFAGSSDSFSLQSGQSYVVALYAVEEVTRPAGVFYSLYTGDKRGALDIIQGTGEYTAATNTFTLTALMSAPIFSSQDNYYIWGIDRGGSTNAPFAQEPNVKFNAVVLVQATAANGIVATLTLIPGGATTLDPSAVHIDGAKVTVSVPASLLPSTGSAPAAYAWNLWTRSGVGGVASAQLAKFAPENALAPFLPGAEAAAPPAPSPGPSGSPPPTTAPTTGPTTGPTTAPTTAPPTTAPTSPPTAPPTAPPTPVPTVVPTTAAATTVHVGFELDDITDPTFGQVAYYALSLGTSAQIIRVPVGAQITFVNDDPRNTPHTASGLGTSGFPASFTNTSGTNQSGTSIDGGLTWSTGTLTPGARSQTFTISAPGTYYFGCAFHYASDSMRDVIVAS